MDPATVAVIACVLVSVSSVINAALCMRVMRRQMAQAASVPDALTELRRLAESAFSYMKAESASDAASANATRIQTESMVRQQEATLDKKLDTVPDKIGEALKGARAGSFITKDADGLPHLLEPIQPGDEFT